MLFRSQAVLRGETVDRVLTDRLVSAVCNSAAIRSSLNEAREFDGRAVPIPPGGCLSPGLAALLGIQSVTADTMKIIREASAVTYVRQQMPPYLLIHGTREFHVPFEQAVSMHEAMKRAGADCTLIPILGGSHGVGGWEKLPQATEYKEQALAWLRSNLRLGQ